jgi:hypothetical protein
VDPLEYRRAPRYFRDQHPPEEITMGAVSMIGFGSFKRKFWTRLSGYLIAAMASASASLSAFAAPPVPLYPFNVTNVDNVSNGAVVLTTKDSLDVVCAWYRKNLPDANGEHKTDDGAHLFYTHNGATVDVEAGNTYSPGTTVGIVWDVKKFGTYPAK